MSQYVLSRLREDVGLESRKRRYGSFVRPANAVIRLAWCRRMKEEAYGFHQDVFTDECSVVLDSHSSRVWVHRGDPFAHIEPRPKHMARVSEDEKLWE